MSAGFLRPPRKLPGFRRYFYFFTLLDKERNPDLKPRLQFGHLGATSARRIATYGRFRFGNLQLDKHRQLQTNRVAVVLVRVEQCTFHQKVQRVADNLRGKAQSLEVFLVQKIRAIPIAVQIADRNQLQIRLLELLTRLEGFIHHCAGEKVAHLQTHQGLPATGGRRAYLCIHAVERNVFKLEDGLALYVNCINEGGQLYPESFASKYRGRPEGSLPLDSALKKRERITGSNLKRCFAESRLLFSAG